MRIDPEHPDLARGVLLEEAASTNSWLRERALAEGAGAWPDLSMAVTANQTAGRGRLDRVWTAPPGSGLAISLLLRPSGPDARLLPLEHWSWLPLVAGRAMSLAVEQVLPPGHDLVGVKWPNDVHIGGRKVSGVLAEILPDGSGLVLGCGVNLRLAREELPVPTATSLALEGAEAHPDQRVLDGFLAAFVAEYRALCAHGGDAEASGTRARVAARCETLGRRVRVLLPDGAERTGTAQGLDASGRLVLAPEDGGDIVTISAGDITHLRY